LLKSKVYFNRPNNLEDLRQRIRAEMNEIEQISPDIIERSVQSVGECQMVCFCLRSIKIFSLDNFV
jgi:hypothetical protein